MLTRSSGLESSMSKQLKAVAEMLINPLKTAAITKCQKLLANTHIIEDTTHPTMSASNRLFLRPNLFVI